jgi:hypothetical protein
MHYHIARIPLAAAFLLFVSLVLNASAAGFDQRVEIALGRGEDSSFRERLGAAKSLYEGLSKADAEALFKGIIAPTQPQGLPLQKWAALYNDVFNAFNAMADSLDNYPERLISLIREEARPTVLRDYALQHLLSHTEFKLAAEAREKLLEALEPIVTAAPDTTLPSTYLLGIWQLAGKPGYPSAEAIGKHALQIAADPEAFTPNRISAIQVCGQLGYEPALEISVSFARDTAMPTALRSASLATIGNLGDPSHRTLLRKIKYTGTSDRRILFATDAALKKLQ